MTDKFGLQGIQKIFDRFRCDLSYFSQSLVPSKLYQGGQKGNGETAVWSVQMSASEPSSPSVFDVECELHRVGCGAHVEVNLGQNFDVGLRQCCFNWDGERALLQR